MIRSANVFIKFQKNSRKEGGHFTVDQYYQPLKHEIDGPNNIAFYAYEHNYEIQKGVSEGYRDTEKILWDEINKFGRFWLMEGYFPPEDRDKWLIAIEALSNINRLVQEDIRDMILTGNDEKYKANLNNEKNENNYAGRNSLFAGDKNVSSNKILNTENSISDSSINLINRERRTSKKGTKAQPKKRNTSRKGTNLSKHSDKRDKEKKVSRKDSLDSSDRIIASLPTNKNGLRPPFVWNFPIPISTILVFLPVFLLFSIANLSMYSSKSFHIFIPFNIFLIYIYIWLIKYVPFFDCNDFHYQNLLLEIFLID